MKGHEKITLRKCELRALNWGYCTMQVYNCSESSSSESVQQIRPLHYHTGEKKGNFTINVKGCSVVTHKKLKCITIFFFFFFFFIIWTN